MFIKLSLFRSRPAFAGLIFLVVLFVLATSFVRELSATSQLKRQASIVETLIDAQQQDLLKSKAHHTLQATHVDIVSRFTQLLSAQQTALLIAARLDDTFEALQSSPDESLQRDAASAYFAALSEARRDTHGYLQAKSHVLFTTFGWLALLFAALLSLVFFGLYHYRRVHRSNTRAFFKRRRRKIQRQMQRFDANKKATQALFKSLDHHLRTPISASIGLLELMKRSSLDSDQIELLGKAETANFQALQQVDTLLDIVRDDLLDGTAKSRAFNVNSVIDESLREFVLPISTGRLTVSIDNTVSSGLCVLGEFSKVKLGVMGVIQQALQASCKPSTFVSFWINSSEQCTELVCNIDYRPRSIATDTLHRPSDNLGLMSALHFDDDVLHQLFTHLGATYTVEEKSSESTCVKLRIPLKVQIEKTPRSTAERPTLDGQYAVIDDLGSSRNLLTQIIEEVGGKVHAFASGSAFLAALKNGERFSAVVMDFHMPALSGLETLELVNAVYHDNRMPIIMMSADPAIQSLSLTQYPMVEQFMVKPIDGDALVDTLWSVRNKVHFTPAKSGVKVLLIEDDAISAEIMSHMLHSMRYEVVHVSSGAQALASVEDQTFDIVLVDIVLPDIDGHTLVAKLKAQSPDNLNAIYISITAHSASEFAEKSDRSGIDYHLTKPITADELARTLTIATNK